MTPLEKARAVGGLTRTTERLTAAGIRHRHPDASARECFLRLAAIKLGRDLTVRVYPDAAFLLDP